MVKEAQSAKSEVILPQETFHQAEKLREKHVELTKKVIQAKFDANSQKIPMSELGRIRTEYKQNMLDAIDWYSSTDKPALQKFISEKKKTQDNAFSPKLRELGDLEKFLTDIDTWKYIEDNLTILEDDGNLSHDSRVTARTITEISDAAIDQEPEAQNLKAVAQEGLKLDVISEMLPKIDEVVEITSVISELTSTQQQITQEIENLNAFDADYQTKRDDLTKELEETKAQLPKKTAELNAKISQFGNEDKQKLAKLKQALSDVVGKMNLEMQRSGSRKNIPQVESLTIVMNACQSIIGQ